MKYCSSPTDHKRSLRVNKNSKYWCGACRCLRFRVTPKWNCWNSLLCHYFIPKKAITQQKMSFRGAAREAVEIYSSKLLKWPSIYGFCYVQLISAEKHFIFDLILLKTFFTLFQRRPAREPQSLILYDYWQSAYAASSSSRLKQSCWPPFSLSFAKA